MSSCCTFRLKRRSAFSRDSPSCSRTSAKLTHPQTRPVGPDSYYNIFALSQEEASNLAANNCQLTTITFHFETFAKSCISGSVIVRNVKKIALGQSCKKSRSSENRRCQYKSRGVIR